MKIFLNWWKKSFWTYLQYTGIGLSVDYRRILVHKNVPVKRQILLLYISLNKQSSLLNSGWKICKLAKVGVCLLYNSNCSSRLHIKRNLFLIAFIYLQVEYNVFFENYVLVIFNGSVSIMNTDDWFSFFFLFFKEILVCFIL